MPWSYECPNESFQFNQQLNATWWVATAVERNMEAQRPIQVCHMNVLMKVFLGRGGFKSKVHRVNNNYKKHDGYFNQQLSVIQWVATVVGKYMEAKRPIQVCHMNVLMKVFLGRGGFKSKVHRVNNNYKKHDGYFNQQLSVIQWVATVVGKYMEAQRPIQVCYMNVLMKGCYTVGKFLGAILSSTLWC